MSFAVEVAPGLLSFSGLSRLIDDNPHMEISLTERGWLRLTSGPIEPTQDFGITEQI